MQIVVPMSGFGERFRRAGYTLPKPLIEVEGKPIVAHVIDMFPGETEFFFICNEDHLETPEFDMEGILKRYCPTGTIVGIPPHKLGPIHAIRQIGHLLDPDQPVVVNYCDFTCYWNWHDFKHQVAVSGCAGAIPAYRGFHPHSLGSTNYAYLRECDGWVEDIQEKKPFTSDRMAEYASSGTYHFASARVMLECFEQAMADNLQVGGEFYVSLAFKPLLARKLPVMVYPLQHFMQWGTPEDVHEYEVWSAAFRQLMVDPEPGSAPSGSVVLPMAGLGQRFAAQGYPQTKPLIPVSGRSMVLQAAQDLPPAQHHVFVLRSDMDGADQVAGALLNAYPGAILASVPGLTEGQACTAWVGLQALRDQAGPDIAPITIGACDNGALYDAGALDRMLADPAVDVVVWGVRGYPNARRHPGMYGWIDEEDGWVRAISVKQALAHPATDPVVVGTFTFRRLEDFERALTRLVQRDGRVNGEFYVDALINDAIDLGLRVRLFEVDSYLCWGTPNDLKTFEYWQSCFHQWAGHPYRLEHDRRVPPEAVPALAGRYSAWSPQRPGARP